MNCFVFFNSVSAKSKIVLLINERDGTVNPPRDALFLCKRLVSLYLFNFSGYVFHVDFYDNLLPINPIIAVAASASALSKLHLIISLPFQKQPSRGVLRKRCSENMQQIYRRIPLSNCDFNKVAKQLTFWKLQLSTIVEKCLKIHSY